MSRILKVTAILAATLMSGSCLPDNFWADKNAEIVNGIIIALVNAVLTPTGIQI